MERYLLDTCAFIDMATDPTLLNADALDILFHRDIQKCMSVESMRELIVNFNTSKELHQYWDSKEEMFNDMYNKHGIIFYNLDENVMLTYANLNIHHKDPSDHIIFCHSMVLGIPLISSDNNAPLYIKEGLDLIRSRRGQR